IELGTPIIVHQPYLIESLSIGCHTPSCGWLQILSRKNIEVRDIAPIWKTNSFIKIVKSFKNRNISFFHCKSTYLGIRGYITFHKNINFLSLSRKFHYLEFSNQFILRNNLPSTT